MTTSPSNLAPASPALDIGRLDIETDMEISGETKKLDVAREQLKEAITLHFNERHPIPIHTLAASAHQVLVDLAAIAGVPSVVKQENLSAKHIQLINFPYNFFKHADRDADHSIYIEPLKRFTLDYIMDGVMMYQKLNGSIFSEAEIFWFWFVSKFSDEFPDDGIVGAMKRCNLGVVPLKTLSNFIKYPDLLEMLKNGPKPAVTD